MGWNGSGVFNRVHNWVTDAAANIKITASRFDAENDEFKAGLENCYTLDSQTTPTADLAMGSNKITGVTDGTGANDAATVGQIQEKSMAYLVTTGSANAYVAAPSPAFTAYAAGQELDIEANFTNTGSATINVSTLGAKTIKDNNGSALVGGEIVSGQIYTLQYDGTDFFIKSVHGLINAAGKQSIWIPAAAMRPTVSNGCAAITDIETTSGRPDIQVLDFDAAADEFAQFGIRLPKSYDGGTITYQAYWTTADTDTGTIYWQVEGVSVSDDDTIDVAYGTAIQVTDAGLGTAEDLHVTSESAALTIAGTPTEGDLAFFRVGRDADNASDTKTGDGRLLGILMHFTTNAKNDA